MKKNLTNCKSCGKEISTNAKACPECGGKVSKPIYKKWWLWVIIIALIVGLAGSGETDSNLDEVVTAERSSVVDSESETTEEETTEEETTEEETTEEETTEEETTEEKTTIKITTTKAETMGQKNALKSAKNYLKFTAFSYEGLIDQLEYEGYSYEDAVYAVDNCGADWYEQAAKCAKNYLDFTAFSKDGLISQLEYEGFTYEQAVYGVEANGY